MQEEEKELHPIYKGWFWCHERQDFFRWKEFINYFKNQQKG